MKTRLMKGSRQVFPRRQIDAGLAADRAVHHREQGRRHLVIIDAPQVARRGKAAQVADHAAADEKDRGRAVEPLLRQKIERPAQLRERLAPLARRHHQGRRFAKDRLERRRLPDDHVAVRDHRRLAAKTEHFGEFRLHLAGQVFPNENGVAPVTELHRNDIRHGS